MTLPTNQPIPVDVLILGAGWTSSFLIPLLRSQSPPITLAATSRSGTPQSGVETIPFVFNPDPKSEEEETEMQEAWQRLPDVKTVVVAFPVSGSGGSTRLVEGWERSRKAKEGRTPLWPLWVQLGSTGIWNGDPTFSPNATGARNDLLWCDRHSPFDTTNKRAIAETKLLKFSGTQLVGGDADEKRRTTVLNLGGLWGGERQIKNWVSRVAPTKEALAGKTSPSPSSPSTSNHTSAPPNCWLLTNLRVYDWWELISARGTGRDESGRAIGPQIAWVKELMREKGVMALPRVETEMGRALDSRQFWEILEVVPGRARLE